MDTIPRQLRIYVDEFDNEPFNNRLRAMRDARGRAVIRTRINRLRTGNFANCEPVGGGVHEQKIDFGPGYRVYFGVDGERIVLLTCGNKSSQRADILDGSVTGETTMPKRTRDYRSTLLEELTDPHEAARYLNAALQEPAEMFLLALRDVAEAQKMSRVARAAGVSRESLYRMLSAAGNPSYKNLVAILRAMGFELAQVAAPPARGRRPARGPGRRGQKHSR